MSSKNNVIEEIQELIQKIKNEYEEGVDFEIPYYSEKHKTGAISHLSPRLKSFLRKKFDFPSGVNDYLDYSKTNSANNYYYRLDGEHGKGEHEEFGQGSKVIAYFHPECAKKYFAGKEQSNENNVRIKEKLLRNLDKICLDPDGYLANNEYLKTDEAEEEYQKTFNLPSEYYEVKRELVKKIKQEIEQNPSEWKIERGKNENYADKNLNQLVKHQPSGRRKEINFATAQLIKFAREKLSNEYLELSKIAPWDTDTKNTTLFVYQQLLIMLHPATPFITEHIYQELTHQKILQSEIEIIDLKDQKQAL
ncbi:5674_t:CDS:2 [Racocetra persica]|uniref:5674_t:CDS:1 n=1 Tax=Racocetra persica TaxID=160502 RepID=A0ACA9NJF8_9GLOM|nr:5674_t:CDS:2 [Racocetra persica]